MGITLELLDTAPEREATPAVMTEAALRTTVETEMSETLKQIEQLSTEEQKQIEDFAATIDLHNSTIIMRYGESTQRKLASLTDNALQGVVGRDIGEVGSLLAEMTVSLKNFNGDVDAFERNLEKKVLGIFRSIKKRAEELQVKYTSVLSTLERVKKDLLRQHTTLMVDIKMLDDLYSENLEYYKELTMYILAGNRQLECVRSGELENLRLKAEQSGLQSDVFSYSDLKDRCENFESQLHDLELTRAVCLQTAPQIRMVQKTDEQLARKIQSSINNTIPIWKQKMLVALAMQHSREAAEAQRELTDLTSAMLTEIAKQTHVHTVETYKEAERAIIDIEAIRTGYTEIMATIDDLNAVHAEGRKVRANVIAELRSAEETFKQKLLSASQPAMGTS